MIEMPEQIVGLLILKKDENVYYRIIYANGEHAVLCEIKKDVLHTIVIKMEDLIRQITNEKTLIIPEKLNIINEDEMSLTEKAQFRIKLSFVREMDKIYGPDWTRFTKVKHKKEYNNLISELGIEEKTARRWIIAYIQSGRQETSLNPQRNVNRKGMSYNFTHKPGKPSVNVTVHDERVEAAFEYGLKYYLALKTVTIHQAYSELKYHSYTEHAIQENGVSWCLIDKAHIPTEKQFYYYICKHTSKEEREKAKGDSREIRNNKRILLSDTLWNVDGPMVRCEVDAMDVSCVLIFSNENPIVIGKPTIYAMVDVYSKAIIAVFISFERDTRIGVTSLLMNILDNKSEYCQKYGFTPSEKMFWPTGYLPETIVMDRGMDFVSDDFSEVLHRLNIISESLPPAMGSYKPNVERLWGKINNFIKPAMEGKGFNLHRHDSHPEKEAIFTLPEFTTFILQTVVALNQTSIVDYPLSADMIAKGVKPIPEELWNYGVGRRGEPRSISNRDQYLFNLLPKPPVQVNISRKTICYQGLYYSYQDSDEAGKRALEKIMYEVGDNPVPFSEFADVRYDPRLTNNLYYILDGEKQIHVAPLNHMKTGMNSFQNMTWQEYFVFKKIAKNISDEAKIQHDNMTDATSHAVQLAANAFEAAKDVAAIRKQNRHARNNGNLKMMHETAKQLQRKENAAEFGLSAVTNQSSADNGSLPVPEDSEEKSDENDDLKELSQEEFLNKFDI